MMTKYTRLAEDIRETAPDYVTAAGMALGIGALAVAAALTREPRLLETAGAVGFFCLLGGFPLLVMRFVPGLGEVLILGGMILCAVVEFVPPERGPQLAAPAGSEVSLPPVLIDKATGCEWIGTSWDHATPRIGPDGASICHGKSTGKPPAASRSPAG